MWKIESVHILLAECLTLKILIMPNSVGVLRKSFFVYILASRKGGVLYTGVTSSLPERIRQHREGLIEGFTKKYHVKTLVYFEAKATAAEAIAREKQIKRWRRSWKVALIEAANPNWNDLWDEIAVP